MNIKIPFTRFSFRKYCTISFIILMILSFLPLQSLYSQWDEPVDKQEDAAEDETKDEDKNAEYNEKEVTALMQYG